MTRTPAIALVVLLAGTRAAEQVLLNFKAQVAGARELR